MLEFSSIGKINLSIHVVRCVCTCLLTRLHVCMFLKGEQLPSLFVGKGKGKAMNIIERKVKWELVTALLLVIVILATCMHHAEKEKERDKMQLPPVGMTKNP